MRKSPTTHADFVCISVCLFGCLHVRVCAAIVCQNKDDKAAITLLLPYFKPRTSLSPDLIFELSINKQKGKVFFIRRKVGLSSTHHMAEINTE